MNVFSLFKRRPFTRLEECLLRELGNNLPSPSDAILRAQIGDIRRATRLTDSREVLFYPKRGREASPPFAANHAELKFATIRFTVPGVQGSWTANFWLVSGRFFSINFSPSPSAIRSASAVQIDECKLLHDPSKAVDLGVEMQPVSRDTVAFPAWVTEIEKHCSVGDAYKPLSAEKRTRFLEEISCSLPDDYLSLLDCTEGLSVGSIGILGLSQVYEVVMPDWNYYLIAEIGSKGMLGVRAHDPKKEIWYLEYDGAPPWQNLGSSIGDAVRGLVGFVSSENT